MKKSLFLGFVVVLFFLSLLDGFITVQLIASHGGDITIELNPFLLWLMEKTGTAYSIMYYKLASFSPLLILFFFNKDRFSLGVSVIFLLVFVAYMILVISELSIIIPEHIRHGHPFMITGG